MTRSTTRRALAALALGLCALFGVVAPAAAQGATPPPTVSAPTTGRISATAAPSSDELQPEDVADWVKDNVALVIVVAGVLLVFGFWKFITR